MHGQQNIKTFLHVTLFVIVLTTSFSAHRELIRFRNVIYLQM